MRVLVVVDMQNDFIDGALANDAAETIIDNVKDKILYYLDDSESIIVGTMDGHTEDYLDTEEGKNLPVPHCIVGTEGFCMHPEIDALFGDSRNLTGFVRYDEGPAWIPKMSIIDKNTFGSIGLAANLIDLANFIRKDDDEIESIELIGLCTDICVIANAIIAKSACPNAHVRIDATCCAGTSEYNHDTALNAMEALQIEIIGQGDEPWR